jgi:hypothetical protein
MEARLLRICVIAGFGNIHFDSKTLALRHHRTYDLLIHHWNQRFPDASM